MTKTITIGDIVRVDVETRHRSDCSIGVIVGESSDGWVSIEFPTVHSDRCRKTFQPGSELFAGPVVLGTYRLEQICQHIDTMPQRVTATIASRWRSRAMVESGYCDND